MNFFVVSNSLNLFSTSIICCLDLPATFLKKTFTETWYFSSSDFNFFIAIKLSGMRFLILVADFLSRISKLLNFYEPFPSVSFPLSFTEKTVEGDLIKRKLKYLLLRDILYIYIYILYSAIFNDICIYIYINIYI